MNERVAPEVTVTSTVAPATPVPVPAQAETGSGRSSHENNDIGPQHSAFAALWRDKPLGRRSAMHPARTLSLAYGGHTSAGLKPRNEDAFGMLLPASQLRFSKGAIAAIADGVSCSDNAQLASRTSVATFIQDYLSTPETWDVKPPHRAYSLR